MADFDSAGSDSPSPANEGGDLYELLGVERSASQDQIKKAYRKAALQFHPDKVDEHQREESEAKFKAITQAYEILRDEQKRALYDEHGMAAFDPARGGPGGGAGPDISDLLSHMFGFGAGPGARGPRGPRRGPDQEQGLRLSLEDLYKGKTIKFEVSKRVVCGTCQGSGAKDKSKSKPCERCRGAGLMAALRQIGPGLVAKEMIPCDSCEGSGNVVKEKDRCRKCKGKRTAEEKKLLELYVPRGSMEGETIVLEGEADQAPDQMPGNLVFKVSEEPHAVFNRIGPDLSADLNVTLAEALCGFSKVILTHLDGRGIHMTRHRDQILRPGDVLKIRGEGMPMKRGEEKGDLYLVVKVEFPVDGWLCKGVTGDMAQGEVEDKGEVEYKSTAEDNWGDSETDVKYRALLRLLPSPKEPIVAEVVDEVDYEDDADLEKMGQLSGDPRFEGEWEDADEPSGPQCQTQ